ncbi:hypothetical protein [Paractinoplanes lichenicola]|uniref:Uncharacterized protein n=1 Tax=Paractinoplanes lichenicola TaxID=2802976 RepID=A0ABS1VMQ1_9ACTN|nr:hypothetical protein [Actinoplanes lichenicola]MBL7255934.1 hypothetical protein [Actinoplanes lichenicola]
MSTETDTVSDSVAATNAPQVDTVRDFTQVSPIPPAITSGAVCKNRSSRSPERLTGVESS